MRFKEINDVNFRKLFSQDKNFFNIHTVEEQKKYLNIFSLYRKLFTEYIIEKIRLKEYDNTVKNIELNMIQTDIKDMDFYQYFSNDVLKYFYLRNNIYIERLEDIYLEKLKKRLDNFQFELDDEARELIEKTYKKIILEDPFGDGKKCRCFFGPHTSKYLVEHDNLVIGMRYDEFAEVGLTDDEWKTQNKKQMIFLDEIFEELSLKASEILDIPVAILRYNEYSIVRYEFEE